MKYKKYIIYIISIIFIGCSSKKVYKVESYTEEIIETIYKEDSIILSIILPYQEAIEDKMKEIVTYTKIELNKNGAESTLGNFVTDLCLNYAEAEVCVMNNGGLRTSIDKGPITVGKLYELMPFENELVILEIDSVEFNGLLKYITKRGGEPFSGISIVMNSKNELISYTAPVNFKQNNTIRILTSDYLANGGDKMWFFKDKEQYKTGLKLRDVIIDHCRKKDTIRTKLDGRIQILNNDK